MSEVLVVGQNLSRILLGVELRRCANEQVPVGLDTETEGINPKTEAPASGVGTISCWSISTPRYEKVFLWADQLEYYTTWLESEAPKVGHNIFSFDYHMFANAGIELSGIIGDTLRMSKLLYCSKMRSHGLKDLAKNWLNIEQPSFNSLFRRPKHAIKHVQESKKLKGEIIDLQYRETKRKVGPHKGVPTLFASGERGTFGKVLEYLPLSRIPTEYPDRLDALYEYASSDALITRLLYHELRTELEKVEWNIQK